MPGTVEKYFMYIVSFNAPNTPMTLEPSVASFCRCKNKVSERLSTCLCTCGCWVAELRFELKQPKVRIHMQNRYSILFSLVLSEYTGLPFQNNYDCLLCVRHCAGPLGGVD